MVTYSTTWTPPWDFSKYISGSEINKHFFISLFKARQQNNRVVSHGVKLAYRHNKLVHTNTVKAEACLLIQVQRDWTSVGSDVGPAADKFKELIQDWGSFKQKYGSTCNSSFITLSQWKIIIQDFNEGVCRQSVVSVSPFIRIWVTSFCFTYTHFNIKYCISFIWGICKYEKQKMINQKKPTTCNQTELSCVGIFIVDLLLWLIFTLAFRFNSHLPLSLYTVGAGPVFIHGAGLVHFGHQASDWRLRDRGQDQRKTWFWPAALKINMGMTENHALGVCLVVLLVCVFTDVKVIHCDDIVLTFTVLLLWLTWCISN